MKITATDLKETDQVAALLLKIDTNDVRFFEEVLEEIHRHQPFVLSCMLGYQYDLASEAFNEILKLHLLIWIFFRQQPAAKKQAITQAQLERYESRNIHLLKYLAGENPNDKSFTAVIEKDLERLRSKALWAACMLRFNEQPVLKTLDSQTRGFTLIRLKSMIECFEENMGN
jgi:hypothetical protein